jgi:FixJ family two-component response regulator
MTGSELAQRVAAERPGLRIVIASGAELPSTGGDGLARLPKPFDEGQLADAIERALKAASGTVG